MNNNAPLLRNMQILYPDFRFEMMATIVGALGYVRSCLFNYMNDLPFKKKEALRHIHKKQAIVTSGTVEICKTLLKYSNSTNKKLALI